MAGAGALELPHKVGNSVLGRGTIFRRHPGQGRSNGGDDDDTDTKTASRNGRRVTALCEAFHAPATEPLSRLLRSLYNNFELREKVFCACRLSLYIKTKSNKKEPSPWKNGRPIWWASDT